MDYFYKGKAIKKNAPVSWIAKADSLAANTNLVCVEDVDNKKNSVLSATAFFSAFTSLTVAHGYQKNYGNWCVVDGTNITTYYGTSATQMSQLAHGLTISDFLTVIIKQKTTQNAEITIMTKEGQFTTATIPHWHGSNGDVLMYGAQAMTNAELSYGLSDTNTDVFLFVDSYGTEGDAARVPRQIQNLGYTAFLACGHGGGNSAQTYPQFETLIALAQPKVCVWCIGMNDPDSSTAINATWKSYAEQFAAACEARGIIPVFTTIPNVPNYRHTFKNDWIKASGHRYVDWAKAVGAESAGSSWYTGMLAGGNDNVHPTELGAKALAMRTVLDVPELANVSKIPTKTSDLINDSGYQTAAQVQTAIDAAFAALVNVAEEGY